MNRGLPSLVFVLLCVIAGVVFYHLRGPSGGSEGSYAAVAYTRSSTSGLQPPYDLIITSGHVIDGTGSPWYGADVGIRDGRIAAIGDLARASAKQKIDAHGRVVAPGFTDEPAECFSPWTGA